MNFTKIVLPHDIYAAHLESVNNVKFTRREIDIIAYLISGKSAKAIASCLSISPKTIEAHMRNIMVKVECNSRDGIIDFIEKSKKLSWLKEYYLSHLTQMSFEKHLLKVSTQLGPQAPTCVIIYWRDQEYYTSLIRYLENHLKLAGIKTVIETREGHTFVSDPVNGREALEAKFVLYAIPGALLKQLEGTDNIKREEISSFIQRVGKSPSSIIALFPDKDLKTYTHQALGKFEHINFFQQENYYIFIILILKKILPKIVLDKILIDFKEQTEAICGSFELTHKETPHSDQLFMRKNLVYKSNVYLDILLNSISARRMALVGSVFCLSALCIWFLMFPGTKVEESMKNKDLQEGIYARSDLAIPTKSSLLDRPHLIARIEESLKGQREIQTVALVGIGGAGKTTLARQYAHQQKSNVVWEINAETKESLINSIESLAYALSKTEEDKKILKELQDIKDTNEREEKIISFVKKKLNPVSSWVLIYDNVEKFTDIQKYFPHDSTAWGNGKIILTTRDSNIQNNNQINNILQVGELDSSEKLNLFTKIMHNGNLNQFTAAQKEETEKFLNEIPPFPLDISIAAYYLKTTKVPYNKYLEHMKEPNKYFVSIQENVLKEATDYTKTRNSIITLSLNKIINESKDFGELLLFISLLDSQNIPRDLLNAYKSDIIVENFIYNLNKYSLVTNDLSSSHLGPVFSIHRSTQEISLNYLIKVLSLETNNQPLQAITEALEKYLSEAIDGEHFSRMKFLISHGERFLSHDNLLTDNIRNKINAKIGCLHYHLRNDIKAKKFLEDSLVKSNPSDDKNYQRIARTLVYLGNIYMELGENKKAKDLLDQALIDYNAYFSEDDVDVARDLAFIGDVYGQIGDYKKGKEALEQSLLIYKKHPESQIGASRALGFIGNVYTKLGEYEKSKNALEQSFMICEKQFSEAYMNIPWVLIYLGNAHRSLGNFEKAKHFLEQGLKAYKEQISEDHPDVAWAMIYLADVYMDLGNYEKAKQLIEKSLIVHNKVFKEDNIRTSWVLFHLGKAHKLLGNLEKAKNFFEKSLITYEKVYGKDHVETARILNSLGQTYLLENKTEKAENTLQKALNIFQQNKHPEGYISLEALADLYLKKYRDATKEGDVQRSKKYKEQTIIFLKKSQEIAEAYLPMNSPQIIKIHSKLKELEKNK